MHLGKKTQALISILALTTLAACSSDNDTPTISLSWSTCEENPELQCSTLEVPVDYQQPEGEKINIAMYRVPATGSNRFGSLILNPGQPKEDIFMPLLQFNLLPESITSRYDIISFDRRGSGKSAPVDCTAEGVVVPGGYPDANDLIALKWVTTCSI